MTDIPVKKTSHMRLLERMHGGQPVEEIVASACQRHDTPEGAASELGVSVVTLRAWRKLFGIDSVEEAAVA